MVTVPASPVLGALIVAVKTALPLDCVQLHCETVAVAGVAVTVMPAGHGALPVLVKVFCAVKPGRVRMTFVPAQPEALV